MENDQTSKFGQRKSSFRILWPENTIENFMKEMEELIVSKCAAVFIAYEEGTAIGFAQCQIRTDYVEGTELNQVGYLEGLFVKSAYRRNG